MAKALKYKLPIITLSLHIKEPRGGSDMYLIRTPACADQWLEPLKQQAEECFVAIHLNSRHEIIGLHEVSRGTLSASLVHPREVFKSALLSNAHAMILAHNHPSGSRLFPSNEDLETTEQLLKAAAILGVQVLDHLIVGPRQTAYSIRENYPHIWKK